MKRRFEVLTRFWMQVDVDEDDSEEDALSIAKEDAKWLIARMVSDDYEDYEVLEVKLADERKESV